MLIHLKNQSNFCRLICITIAALIVSGCSMFAMIQKYRPPKENLPNGYKNGCSRPEGPHLERILVANGAILIDSTIRNKFNSVGPIFVPIIPYYLFEGDKSVGLNVTVVGGKRSVFIDFNNWQVSVDQKNWMKVEPIVLEDSSQLKGNILDTSLSKVRSVSITFPLKMIDHQEIYLRFGGIKIDNTLIPEGITRWERSDESVYIALIAPHTGGPAAALQCK